LLVLVLLASCGRKTMPVPPQEVVLTPVSDLRFQLDGQEVTLTWTAPGQGVGNSKLSKMAGFEILRAEIPEERYCAGCPLPFGAPISYSSNPRPGETIRYQEKSLRPGHRYLYKVYTRYGWHQRSPASNMITFSRGESPPSPPVELNP
jgi:uncharacterized protein